MTKYLTTLLLVSMALLFTSPMAAKNTAEGGGVQKGVYFPNTETLAPDEMRIIALGTGLPTPLTRAQKSANFMVELGNAISSSLTAEPGRRKTCSPFNPGSPRSTRFS